MLIALAACGSKHDEPQAKPVAAPIEPPAAAPAAPATAEPSHDEIEAEAAKMTRDAIPGPELAPFVPDPLGGIALSNRLDQAFAYGAAYKLPDGGYANLDIQNTFIRGTGDDSLVHLTLDSHTLCPKTETIAGGKACVKVEPDRTRLYWYLPDRLTVTLSAPTEALARKMAGGLRIADLAKLSAKH